MPPIDLYLPFRASDRRRSTRYPSGVDREEIVRVLRAFEASALEYVLIGATAMGFHGLVRATEDVDLLIRATPENVERLRAALRQAYAGDPCVEELPRICLASIRFSDTTRRPATCTSTS